MVSSKRDQRHGSRVATWLAALSICAASFGMLVWRPSGARAVADKGKGSLILLGSSSMNGSLGRLLADDFTDQGYRVARHGYAAAGLARPDFRDIREKVDQLPIAGTTTAALLYFGGNDAQSIWLRPEERARHHQTTEWVYWNDDRWSGIYESRMNKLVRSLCARGVQHAVVLSPGDVTSTRLQGRLERVRKLQQRATQNTPCGHYVSTAGDVSQFETMTKEPLRTPDGVHMTRLGARRVWKRIRPKVMALISGESKRRHDSERDAEATSERLSRR